MNEMLIDYDLHVGDHPTHDAEHGAKIAVRGVSFWYGEKQALEGVDLDIFEREVTAFIGPSGCGKSTLLKCLNRTNEIIPGTRIAGRITLDGQDIYRAVEDPVTLRRRFGWVAQKPNPFPKSVYANVAYGARLHGVVTNRADEEALVEDCLTRAGLWDEIKDRLKELGTDLSGGQQQRLCIARALSTKPDIILMDEPCSALDPRATAYIEDLIDHLRERYTIVIITHNMQQAARISQRVAFFHLGKLVEAGDAEEMFLRPQTELCQRYITGQFG